jgi:hypothetical protein
MLEIAAYEQMMSGFEYLIALTSVVAGLCLTRALSGLARMVHLRVRAQVQMSDIHVIWTANILLWLVSYWWFTYTLASVAQWTIPLFLWVLVYGALIFFLIALLYPENLDSDTGLFSHFMGTRRWFFGTFIGLGVVDIADVWVKMYYGVPPPPMQTYSMLMIAWFSVGIIGAYTGNPAIHRIIAYLWFGVIALNATLGISPGVPI